MLGSEFHLETQVKRTSFSPSILIVIKFCLGVLFVSLEQVFLLEGKKLRLNLNVKNHLHKVGGV